MYKIYKKNELSFSLIWIVGYVVVFSMADNISNSYGVLKIVTAPVAVVFVLLILGFVKKHSLMEEYGLCSFKGNVKDYLYFIPLILIMSINLWNGIAVKNSCIEIILFVISMICVGFIEEVIFRGFLFRAISRDNIKLAVIISSVTFGMGHIVNLLNGHDLVPTLLQICYATAIGFLFTILFYKGRSLWPCIITHGIFNSLSIVGISSTLFTNEIIISVVLSAVSIAYALWILKNKE